MTLHYHYYRIDPKKAAKKRKHLFARPERAINPDTGKPFRDPRSKITGDGRVICRGADMTDLRERVGLREAELCQGCEGWAPIYPPEGTLAGEMHHKHGRGMGSSKRNDIAAEMDWLCQTCHRKAKIEPMFRAGDEA